MTTKFVIRTFRIGGSAVGTDREGLAAQAVSDLIRLGPEAMLAEYLKSADVEAFNGRGEFNCTKDIKQAMRFDSHEAAFEFWRRQSKTRPLRPDGKPNRPLTAINVTFEKVEE